MARDAEGEGAVPGRWGCNVSGPDGWTRLVVVVVSLL